ncbi:ATP-binding protein [Dactylosporangium sp. CA-092794]|uniref:ATP-binding protein n=1 Tax=Dactylosporangium sp. CA-092794 TaxID=3239929 RepID=UPI003D8ABDF2
MSELTARLDLPLWTHAPAAARRAVTGVLLSWGLDDPAWLDAAEVVVSELVTNACLHGGGAIELSVRWHDPAVTVSVVDGASVVPHGPGPNGTGGAGMTIIEALTTRWGVEDHQGGKRMWVELPPAPAGPRPSAGTAREALA